MIFILIKITNNNNNLKYNKFQKNNLKLKKESKIFLLKNLVHHHNLNKILKYRLLNK